MIPAITAILSVIYVVLVARETRRPCRREGDWRVVEYPLSTQVPAILACVVMLWFATRFGIVFLLALPPFVVWASYLLRARIRFNESELQVSSLLQRTRVIPMSSVVGVHPGIAGWRVATASQGWFGFNHMQRGWTELRRALGGS